MQLKKALEMQCNGTEESRMHSDQINDLHKRQESKSMD